MADACAQLSHLRHTVDSIVTSLEVNASNFARIANDMVHLHKDDYVLACFKNKEAAQAVITRVVEFLQSRGLDVGSKLVGSGLFATSSPSSSQNHNEVVKASRDVSMKGSTPPPEASTSGGPVAVVEGELDGEGDVEEEQSGAPDYLYFMVLCSHSLRPFMTWCRDQPVITIAKWFSRLSTSYRVGVLPPSISCSLALDLLYF